MNHALVKKLLQRDDLCQQQLLESIQSNGHRTLITIHRGTEVIHGTEMMHSTEMVLERVMKNGDHH